jgi:primosomal protein N'
VKRRKGEVVTLYCSSCSWSTELPLAETESSRVVSCTHCGKPIYWHACEQCGLKYVGNAMPECPICDDGSLDSLGDD